MKIKISFILTILLLSCNTKQKESNQPTLINVLNALENMELTELSFFVDSVVYVPLELTEKSLVTVEPKIETTEDFIIVRNWGHKPPLLLVFDREIGKFIRELGTMGRGPNEFSRIPLSYFNPTQKIIYTLGNNDNVLTFNLQGDLKDIFKIPNCFEIEGMPLSSGSFDTYLDSNTFVSYVSNYSGNEKKKIVLFSRDTILKIFPNYLSWKRTPSRNINVFSLETTFYHYDNRLFFKEAFNDTLFEVKNTILIPRFVFSFGKYGIPYALQDEYMTTGKLQNAITLDNFTENKNYLFFTIKKDAKSYLSYYDKRKKTLKVCEGTDSYPFVIIDDINDFLPITKFHINDNNELICYFDAFTVRKWIESNQDKARSLGVKYPWLKEFDESGNPVIMIAKCKN